MTNLSIRGSVLAVLYLCVLCNAITQSADAQPFTTVINVPPDPTPDPAFIGSDTQLNLFGGGILLDGFNLAGTLNGPNSNIEVNINGGAAGNNLLVGVPAGFGTNSDVRLNVNSGTVGNFLTVNDGGTLNINGGSVGDWLEVNAGGVVNLNGGTLGDRVTPLNGSTVNIHDGSIGDFFEPRNNTNINVTGGTIGDDFSLGFDTKVSISGGIVSRMNYVGSGGTLEISGGNIESFIAQGTDTTVTGSEFLLDGAPIPGLETPGNSVTIPTGSGLLTTTFADGAVFASSLGALGDTLTLVAANTPAKQPVINSPNDPAPLGLRSGQTLNLSSGAELVKFFTATDSTLNINGGSTGKGLTTYGTEVMVTDGTIDEYFRAFSGSVVTISGGQVENGVLIHESLARINGGHIKGIDVVSNSTVDIFGGTIDNIDARSGGQVNFTGLSFILDGVDITPDLTPGERVIINDRDVVFKGLLADGSPFSLDLDSTSPSVSNNFETSAILTVTLVPEPGAMVTTSVSVLCLFRRQATA